MALNQSAIEQHPGAWERVVRKLRAGQMPPQTERQPPIEETRQVIEGLTKQLDAAYAQSPRLATTETLRRLTRSEYQRAIRDLLGISIDAASLLPPDESSESA